MWINRTLGDQRKALTALFEPKMLNLAKKCVAKWAQPDSLDQILRAEMNSIPQAHLLYVIDKFGQQISSNVCVQRVNKSCRGQDLSHRPFSVSFYSKRYFMLSSVYISQTTGCPCISAIQPVIKAQQVLGFVVADFDIRQLPLAQRNHSVVQEPYYCQQHSPKPMVISTAEQHIDDALAILSQLFNHHGIFHCTWHFSSGQAVLWHLDNPYEYQIHAIQYLLNTDLSQLYPRSSYTVKAVLSPRQVRQVLERFRHLRLADSTIYLRSGSINIINGMIGLCFSCDGAQYLPAEIFLNKDLSYWLGATVVNAN
ncbi:MAG: hypothetical protein SVR94_20135 [Pseudomonadota bacterium]|nr:hypothetical protein [Pseudomonadota bacterium]